jgi:hypothetical protein
MRDSARADDRYQSRESPAGKPSFRLPRLSSIAYASGFCVAAWANSWPLLFVTATALMWRLPARPLAAPPALALPRERVTIRLDLPFLIACWALATWALWQHRLLPLAVCAGALLLALVDAEQQSRQDEDSGGLASRSAS